MHLNDPLFNRLHAENTPTHGENDHDSTAVAFHRLTKGQSCPWVGLIGEFGVRAVAFVILSIPGGHFDSKFGCEISDISDLAFGYHGLSVIHELLQTSLTRNMGKLKLSCDLCIHEHLICKREE